MLTAPNAQAASIVVGEVSFTIPNPVGFAPLTSQMKGIYEVERRNVPSNAERLGEYIPESEVGKALDDAVDFRTLKLDRTFWVQVTKAVIAAHVKPSDFGQLKAIIRMQNDELVRKAEREVPENMKNANDYLNNEYGKTVEVLGLMALPVHEETDHSIAYSLFQKASVTDRAGVSTTHVFAVTTSFLYLKGKVLVLYCNAEKEGLEWSRAALRQWTDAIMAANSP